MKTLIFALLLSGFSAGSTTVSSDPARPSIDQEGKLFTLKFTPKSRRLEVALVGNETATLEPGRFTVFGKQISSGGESKELNIVPIAGHFEIKDALSDGAVLKLKVEDKKTKKTEEIQMLNVGK